MHFSSIDPLFLDIHPDNHNSSESFPDNNHVISRNKNGEVLSIYSDDIWNFSYYSTTAISYPLNFKTWSQNPSDNLTHIISNQMKQIIFAIIYLHSNKIIQGNTLRQNYNSLRFFAKIAYSLNLNLKQAFKESSLFFNHCVSEISKQKRSYATTLIIILNNIYSISIKYKLYDFSFSLNKINELKSVANSRIDDINQTKVIPSRIYSELLLSFDKLFPDFVSNKENILAFAKDENKINILSKKISINNKIMNLKFSELKIFFGLETYFENNNITSFKTFSYFISNVHILAKFAILMYTGMRASEAQTLPFNSYTKLKNICGFSGFTSKLSKNMVKEFWVSSSYIENAVLSAQLIAKIAALRQDIEITNESTFPLFASSSRISHANTSKSNLPHYEVITFDADDRFDQSLKKLCKIDLKLTQEDINELINIEANPTLESKLLKLIGTDWHFHPHQFRRSLAIYAIRDANASMYLLKKQFKHLYLQMTAYYSKNSSYATSLSDTFFNNSFIKEFRAEEVFQSFLYFEEDVLKNNNPLFGAEGTRLQLMKNTSSLPILYHDRNETLKAINQGRISYQRTFLGGCSRLGGTCGESEITYLTACFNCTNSIFNDLSIKKLIRIQEKLKNDLTKLSNSSPEYLLIKQDVDSINKLLIKNINVTEI